MSFLKKNWIIISCILIVFACFCLLRSGISSFSYPKGSGSTILMLGIVFGTKFIFSKINKKFGDKYTRRLDRIFVYITVPMLVFTSFGFFQKTQTNNAKKEMQSIIENRIQGQPLERKKYDQVAYGELAPILQIINDTDHIREKKEEEYLGGIDSIYVMINSENLSEKKLRDDNKKQLITLLEGVGKYSAWFHSEMSLLEEKIKKLGYGDAVLKGFRNSSKVNLSLNDELMDAYSDLIISVKKIIEFVEKHQKEMYLVDGNIEWKNEKARENLAQCFKSMIDTIGEIDEIVEKQTEYQQQVLEKINK